jgi:hypothetical protein
MSDDDPRERVADALRRYRQVRPELADQWAEPLPDDDEHDRRIAIEYRLADVCGMTEARERRIDRMSRNRPDPTPPQGAA